MSDLREALKLCPFCGSEPDIRTRQDEDIWTHNTVTWTGVHCVECGIGFDWPPGAEPTAVEQWNTRAALAQPEAVEPVAVLNGIRDALEERGYFHMANGRDIGALLDATPPLATNERMRRALGEWLDAEIADASSRQRASFHAGNDKLGEKYYGRHIALLEVKQKMEALSRADEGKESEGGRELTDQEQKCVEAALFASGTVIEELHPSDPTPQDREAIARVWPAPMAKWPDPTPEMLDGDALFDAIWHVIKSWDVNVPSVYNGYCGTNGNHARAIYDAVKPILALQTRAGDNLAVSRITCHCHDDTARKFCLDKDRCTPMTRAGG